MEKANEILAIPNFMLGYEAAQLAQLKAWFNSDQWNHLFKNQLNKILRIH